MKTTQRIILSNTLLALLILFAICGCQTTNTNINAEQQVSNIKSDNTPSDIEEVEHVVHKSSMAEKKTDQSKEDAELDQEHIEKFQKRLFGMLGAHGTKIEQGVDESKQTADDITLKSVKPKDRPFKDDFIVYSPYHLKYLKGYKFNKGSILEC